MLKWILLAIGILIIMGADRLTVVVNNMANAIKTFEGWWTGSRSYRNNNPGNLKFRNQPGAVGADETGHAIFDTFQSGWNALLRQLEVAFTGFSNIYSPDDTFYSFFSKYSEENSREYAEFVALKLNVDPNMKLKDLLL